MVKSDLSRINIIALLSGILTIYLLVLVVFFPHMGRQSMIPTADESLLFLVPLSFVVLIVYALVVRVSLAKSIAAGRESSAAYRYGTAAFEALFPTILIFVFSSIMDPIFLLVSAVVLLYAVFIFSTTLQMDPKIPLFACFVASAGYLAAYLWFRDRVAPDEYPSWIMTPSSYATRVLLLFLCGLVSAFVAWQIQKRVLRLAAATEEKNRITRTFGQHVSPQVVDRLLKQRTKLSSEMRNVCVMFLDIRNFTTFSENREPEEVVHILNQLFTFMIEITNRNDGIINKFLGDGFMAVFGAPFSGGQDCLNAVNASREIVEELEKANRKLGESLGVGIGLHAGEALTGDVGSVERKEYTIMGDVVNVASRIEGLNKTYGSQVLVSAAVYDQLPADQRDFKDLGAAKVKGREKEVRIYQAA